MEIEGRKMNLNSKDFRVQSPEDGETLGLANGREAYLQIEREVSRTPKTAC
jgi:hypothetical protein